MGVEPLPGEVPYDTPRDRRRAPSSGRVSDPGLLRLEKPAQVRLHLQRRAPRNLQRHITREVGRVVVLILGDLVVFALMRALLRAIRDSAVFGDAVAQRVHALLPQGMLNGWQFAVALVVGLFVTGNYGPGDQRRSPRRLFLAAALATALPLWMTIWTRGLELVAAQYLLLATLAWAGLVVERLMLDRLIEPVTRRMRRAAPTIFVGPAQEARAAARSAAFAEGNEYLSLGFVDTHLPPAPDAMGHVVDFAAVLADTRAETVVVCGYLTDGGFHDVVDAALTAGCQVLSVPRAIAVAGVQPTIVWRRRQALVELTALTLRGWQLVVKRAMDIVGASLGLVLLSPVLLVVAVLVKLGSPGPMLFRQERVGRGGRRFKIIKFRTMVLGAEARRDELLEQSIYADPRLFKMVRDPRVTHLGQWLRHTSLDEVPQLFNVLRGDMSLVGPRPPLPSEVELYEAHHYARFDVKPGMTGPWQVSGRNEITDFERVVQLETDYRQNWSLGRDVAILLRTIPVVLGRRGAV